jgi:hypothetical protein
VTAAPPSLPASATPPEELLELELLELEPPTPASKPPDELLELLELELLELLELLLELLELELPLLSLPLELLEEPPPAPPSYAMPEPTCTMHPPPKMTAATSALARVEIWQFNIEESPSRLHAHFARLATVFIRYEARPTTTFSLRGKGKDDAAPNLQWHGKNHSINRLLPDAIGTPLQGGML